MTKIFFYFSLLFTLIFGQSCATHSSGAEGRLSSRVVYSLMTRDKVALEAFFSEDLKKSLNGEMFLGALASLEKSKGDMEAIAFMNTKGKVDSYDLKFKRGSSDLKLYFNEEEKLDNIWVDGQALRKK